MSIALSSSFLSFSVSFHTISKPLKPTSTQAEISLWMTFSFCGNFLTRWRNFFLSSYTLKNNFLFISKSVSRLSHDTVPEKLKGLSLSVNFLFLLRAFQKQFPKNFKKFICVLTKLKVFFFIKQSIVSSAEKWKLKRIF